MKFTLILATLGRSDEVRRMLESLKRQSYQDFEVVLIDQNSDRPAVLLRLMHAAPQ